MRVVNLIELDFSDENSKLNLHEEIGKRPRKCAPEKKNRDMVDAEVDLEVANVDAADREQVVIDVQELDHELDRDRDLPILDRRLHNDVKVVPVRNQLRLITRETVPA